MDFNRSYGWSGQHCIQTECKYYRGFSFQIYEELDNLASEYSNVVSKLQIGQSYEKRPLYVLKVWSHSISWTLSVHVYGYTTLYMHYRYSTPQSKASSCWGLNWQAAQHHAAICSPSPSGMGERIRKKK